jgi:bacillithiol synthase
MKATYISYQKTQKFSRLVTDYLAQSVDLLPYVSAFPTIEGFKERIAQKSTQIVDRDILVSVLGRQNAYLSLSDSSQKNIKSLAEEHTFTVTTGHQLCLFTGPLYFIYKIISTINLTQELKKKYPDKHFVPVFWMATEDHDLEEVNHIHLFGKTIRWKTEQKGAVGSMSLEGMGDVLQELKSILGESENAQALMQLFSEAYLKHQSLAEAMRYLVNELFGEYGLVILDGDDARLKKQFVSTIKKDVLQQGFQKTISDCSAELAVNYKAQAYVRPINFFRLSDGGRVRIEGRVGEQEIESNPENFSPNVLMRPLYQETILPNLAYIGGGAEVAYWMQLKTAFEQENIPFPMLVLRNSAMWMDTNQCTKTKKLGLSEADLFTEEIELHKQYVTANSDKSLDLQEELKSLEQLFESVMDKTSDEGMKLAVRAELKKQMKSLQSLEKRLLKSAKKKHENSLQQISNLKNNLFPNNGLQERYNNFIPYYLKYGENFIKTLQEELNPINNRFIIIKPA